MKAADVRALTVDQIDDEVLKLKKEQFNLRFQRATGQLENTARVRVIRRDIARLKTIGALKRIGATAHSPAPASKPKPASKPEATAENHAHARQGCRQAENGGQAEVEEEVRGSRCRNGRCMAWWSATSRTRP